MMKHNGEWILWTTIAIWFAVFALILTFVPHHPF